MPKSRPLRVFILTLTPLISSIVVNALINEDFGTKTLISMISVVLAVAVGILFALLIQSRLRRKGDHY